MKRQLTAWEEQFGTAYTNRNIVDHTSRRVALQEALEGCKITHALEVGCNRGHNLLALSEFLDAELVGIEPNHHAISIARASSSKIAVLHGNCFDLPFKNAYFDLVFTAGVLIHIALEDLPIALREIYRVASRYILAIEYFAEQETVIPYRGENDLLWKRDFLRHYLTLFPALALVRQGNFNEVQWSDRVSWWLLEKPASPSRT